MSTSNQAEVITFDNLLRPTDVVGEFTELKALQPTSEPFVNANAAGSIRKMKTLGDIRECATKSGERIKAMLSA